VGDLDLGLVDALFARPLAAGPRAAPRAPRGRAVRRGRRRRRRRAFGELVVAVAGLAPGLAAEPEALHVVVVVVVVDHAPVAAEVLVVAVVVVVEQARVVAAGPAAQPGEERPVLVVEEVRVVLVPDRLQVQEGRVVEDRRHGEAGELGAAGAGEFGLVVACCPRCVVDRGAWARAV